MNIFWILAKAEPITYETGTSADYCYYCYFFIIRVSPKKSNNDNNDNDNYNNNMPHLYSALFIKCSKALYIHRHNTKKHILRRIHSI